MLIERLHVMSSTHCAEGTAAKEVWLLYQICPITTMVSKIPIVERNYRYLVVKIHMCWQVGSC